MTSAAYLEAITALLPLTAFLFLWRQSGIVSLGWWALGWALDAAIWLCVTGSIEMSGLRIARGFLEFAFVMAVAAAVQTGSARQCDRQTWPSLNPTSLLPFILKLSVGAVSFATLFLASHFTSMKFVDAACKTSLAFAALALWIRGQNDRLTEMARDLDRARRETLPETQPDYLTGLPNQDSLRKRMDTDESFGGVVAVCDLDGFKSVNDRYGHLIGDEVLRSVGNLLRSSIRSEDRAYRWGGDEFAILFSEPGANMASNRMQALEARLTDFRIRGHGSLCIQFSWGVAEGQGGPLRKAIENADRAMYEQKRQRK